MKKVNSLLNKALLVSLLMAMPLMFFGQTSTKAKKDVKKTQATIFTPYLFLQGDIGPSWPWAEVAATRFVPDFRSNVFQVNGNLSLGYQFKDWLNVYGNLTRGFVSGRLWSAKNSYYAPYTSKNLLFSSDYYGADLNLGFNLSNLFAGAKDRKFSVGAHVGLGQIQWKTKLQDEFLGTVYSAYGYSSGLPALQGKGIDHRKVALSIPVGLNLAYKINDTWTVYGDYTYAWLDTDLLDGIVSNKGIGGNDAILRANFGVRLNLSEIAGGSKTMAKKFNQDVKLKASPEPLVEKGGAIAVTIKGTFAPNYFNKNSVMIIQPVLKYEGGKTLLKPIILEGEQVAGEGTLINYKNGGSFSYTTTVPFVKGMEIAELQTAPVIYAYTGQEFNSAKTALAQGKKAIRVAEIKLADGTIVTANDLQLAPVGVQTAMAPVAPGQGMVYKFAPDGYQKVTVKTNTSEIHFRVNVARLDWWLPLNRNKKNYQALKDNLSNLQKGWAVKGIEIDGWASPEGTSSFNRGLSELRAMTAEKYLKGKIKRDLRKKDNGFAFKNLNDITITTHANGPDWNGFMKAIEKSNIKDRSAILNVINSVNESKKETEIRNMIQIYPVIEREILPSLRRAIINVNAYEPKRTDAEILQLATSPDYAKLSVPELLYAATLTNNLNTKAQIYTNLSIKEPRCWRAVANGGAVETALGNYNQAKALLMKAIKMNPKAPVVRNSMGILQAKQGNFKNAEHCFTKAQKLGADEDYNLGVVNIMKGNYAKAVNLLSGTKCDYNLGLAQLLNGNYDAAANTLKCAKQRANTEYLLAIIGARQGNKTMMLDYLAKAIKMNPNYAAKASTDREFLKYFNDPDFKALVSSK